ncbi:MAG: hypothetical protein KGL44_03860 [Sphingomonadales bacterium]|nr:hypothetical protein [Sphingomonadales bacterium]
MADDGEWVPPIKIDIPSAFQGTWVRSDIPDCVKDDPYSLEIGPRSIYRYEAYEFLEIAALDYSDDPPQFAGMFIVARGTNFGRVTERLRMQGSSLIVSTGNVGVEKPTGVQTFKRCTPVK